MLIGVVRSRGRGRIVVRHFSLSKLVSLCRLILCFLNDKQQFLNEVLLQIASLPLH
nr:MAG TPA: hypothetical protein [Caudoviricetes sp.]